MVREAIAVAEKPIVIVGAGLAGLSAAIYLQKFGRMVTLLEATDRPGGRVATDNINGFLCDRGFQLINTQYPELKALGVSDQIDFIPLSRTIDVSFPDGIVEIGDPRQRPRSIFDSRTGSMGEKASFLKYLARSAGEKTSVGYQMKVAGLGKFYTKVLRPFLTGVFFADPEIVDSRIGSSLIRHFITGRPSIPRSGAGELPRVLAQQVKDIRYNTMVEEISGLRVRTNNGEIAASGIIVATDGTTAAQLLSLPVVPKFSGSITWYHSTPSAPTTSANLRIDGSQQGPILNSLIISHTVPEMAPAGYSLISTTTLLGVSETEVRTHLATLWRTSTHNWELVAKYEMRNSLPLFSPGQAPITQKVSDKVFIAGDYCLEPSQNGALLSGRLAAQELTIN